MNAYARHVERTGALAILLGPSAEQPDVDSVEAFGGGWRHGVQLWRGISFDYLLMLADSRLRIEKLAPLVLLAHDRAALMEIVSQTCDRLAGLECVWIVTDRGPGGQAVQAFLADQIEVAGHA